MKSADFRLAVRTGTQDVADRVVAEAWEAGALGVEELARDDGVDLFIYLDRSGEEPVRAVLARFPGEEVVVGEMDVLEDLGWSEAWKEGLESLVISPRLVVRPSFVPHALLPGQQEVVVDPGQAFGTGGHESTRLILNWVDALMAVHPFRWIVARSRMHNSSTPGATSVRLLAGQALVHLAAEEHGQVHPAAGPGAPGCPIWLLQALLGARQSCYRRSWNEGVWARTPGIPNNPGVAGVPGIPGIPKIFRISGIPEFPGTPENPKFWIFGIPAAAAAADFRVSGF